MFSMMLGVQLMLCKYLVLLLSAPSVTGSGSSPGQLLRLASQPFFLIVPVAANTVLL